nr:MAG TPA: hypothetical protein [Bacteriophage sp.]
MQTFNQFRFRGAFIHFEQDQTLDKAAFRHIPDIHDHASRAGTGVDDVIHSP